MIVMSGASGKLGRAAAAAFAALGAADRVVLGSRTPAALSDLAAQGFGTVAFDFDDPAG
ncbi:SDR family NAD(P)-dependent oxidoreductase, partial [Thioclava sp. BHET1]